MATEKSKKRIGRPSTYTPEIADEICEQIVLGKSLVAITRENIEMPNVATVYRWMREHADFCNRYARARQDQADTLADEITDIADNEPDPNKARVRVDARKWVAAKLKPKKYGDRQVIEHDLVTVEDKLRQLSETK